MENASKALLIAAGVLMLIIVLSALVLMMSNLTDYQEQSYKATADAQTTEFNNQYITYARDDVRGNDMVSLMNRIVDYNARYESSGYTTMHIKVYMKGNNTKLAYDGTNRLVTKSEYDETTIKEIVGEPTLNGSTTTGKIRTIEQKYEQKYANQLASEISNIEAILNDRGLSTSQKNTEFDKEKWLPKSASSYGGIDTIYQDALVYYEYVQFKRAYFDCKKDSTKYDEDTGRIIYMEFECTGIGV